MSSSRAPTRPVTVVASAVAGLLLVALVVVVLADGDEETTTPTDVTTTSVGRATTTAVVAQMSLVTDDADGPLFTFAGVDVAAEELRSITHDSEVPEEYETLIDEEFAAAQREAGLALERLERQVQHLANRLGPAAERSEAEAPVAVVARPTDDGGSLDAPVLIVNTADAERVIARLDLRILDADGAAITERVRFLAELAVVIPPRTAWFNVLSFSPEQVVAEEADLARYTWEAEVVWEATAADG